MPPQTAETLQKHINRRKFGKHPISVDINTLFDNLGGNKNRSMRPWVWAFLWPFAKLYHPFVLNAVTVMGREFSMEQADGKLVRYHFAFQLAEPFLRSGDRVGDAEDIAPGTGLRDGDRERRFDRRVNPAQMHIPRRWRFQRTNNRLTVRAKSG